MPKTLSDVIRVDDHRGFDELIVVLFPHLVRQLIRHRILLIPIRHLEHNTHRRLEDLLEGRLLLINEIQLLISSPLKLELPFMLNILLVEGELWLEHLTRLPLLEEGLL